MYFSQTKSLSPSSSSLSCLRPHERLVCHDYGNVHVTGRAKLALSLRSRVAGLRSREVKIIKKRHTEGCEGKWEGKEKEEVEGMGRKYFGVKTGRPVCFSFPWKLSENLQTHRTEFPSQKENRGSGRPVLVRKHCAVCFHYQTQTLGNIIKVRCWYHWA